MQHSLSSAITLHHDLELEAHISLDDVILKAYEEAQELSVALQNGDANEIQKEARDVLVNVLSVAAKITDIDALNPVKPDPAFDILSLIARFGRETASLRNRYSRENISLESYDKTVSEIIGYLLPLIGDTVETSVKVSSEKFRARIREYLPDIHLEDHIAGYPDFPKPGILFRDISPLLAHPEALRYASFEMAKHAKDADVIAGLDARGFVFATRVADILGKPFVMVRKKGKLPGETVGTDYSLEYGNNSIEIQKDAIKPGMKVALIDDLLATGGTLGAAVELILKVGAKVSSLVCLISLDEPFLANMASRESLESKFRVKSILHYD